MVLPRNELKRVHLEDLSPGRTMKRDLELDFARAKGRVYLKLHGHEGHTPPGGHLTRQTDGG